MCINGRVGSRGQFVCDRPLSPFGVGLGKVPVPNRRSFPGGPREQAWNFPPNRLLTLSETTFPSVTGTWQDSIDNLPAQWNAGAKQTVIRVRKNLRMI